MVDKARVKKVAVVPASIQLDCPSGRDHGMHIDSPTLQHLPVHNSGANLTSNPAGALNGLRRSSGFSGVSVGGCGNGVRGSSTSGPGRHDKSTWRALPPLVGGGAQSSKDLMATAPPPPSHKNVTTVSTAFDAPFCSVGTCR